MKLFRNIGKKIKQKRVLLLFLCVFSFLGGFFIADCVNRYQMTYVCEFRYEGELSPEELLDPDRLSELQQSDAKYQNIDTEKLLSQNGIFLEGSGPIYALTTYARYYDTIFVKASASVSTRAKTFIRDLILGFLGEEKTEFLSADIIQTRNRRSPYLYGLYAFIIAAAGFLIFAAFVPEKEDPQPFYDNQTVFRTPFHRQYWKYCTEFLSSPRKITTTAMLFALQLLSKMIVLPSGFGNMGISFGFLFFSLICIIDGPIAGILIGCLSDTLGYFLFDSSGTAFFIGYVFQAMVTGFIYGILLYRTRLSYFRILLTRLGIGLISNVLIGSLSWGFVAGYTWEQTWAYLLLLSLPKNLVYLLPQSILLYLVVKALSPVLVRFRYLQESVANNISLI